VSDLLHLAASGRTSIPVDKETPKALYRTAGYRICGERAVRVDILERLADLIRPALSWREGAPGPKPDGVFDGRCFLVTGAMTSLTGASGEDFASILRSLGYRMDRKPKPAEVATTIATAVAAGDASPAPTDSVPAESPPAEAVSVADAQSRTLLPEPEIVPPVQESAGAATGVTKSTAEVAATDVTVPPVQTTDNAQIASIEGKSTEEPAFIETWRPAGRSERRPHRPRRAQRAPTQPAS